MPIPETLKSLIDVEIRKTQPVKQKQMTLFEYMEKFIRHSTEGTRMNIKRLKTILNEATERGINRNLAFRSKYFSRLNEETDTIYLNEKEI